MHLASFSMIIFRFNPGVACIGSFFLFVAVLYSIIWGFPGGLVAKNPPASVGDGGLITGSGRSSGGGHGNPLWYSCLETLMDRGAWWATVHWVMRESRHNLVTKQQFHDINLWQFVYPFFCWWMLGLFPVWGYNKAAMNICIQVFVWTYDFLSFLWIPGISWGLERFILNL